jgi:hypothetical protein
MEDKVMFKLGDVVTYNGIGPLVIVDVYEDGSMRAYNRTLQVTVSDSSHFRAVEDHGK